MTLYDPELDELAIEQHAINDVVLELTRSGPDWDDPAGLEELRNLQMPGQEPLEDTETGELPGPGGPIPYRLRRPEGTPTGVYLDIHGGGMCIGRAESNDATNAALAADLGVAVVSIDYRLAPEHPFPAGPDDCEAAARWLIDHAGDELGTDRLLIGGGSAGAYLASLALLRLRDQGLADRFRAANLVFGVYDLGMTPSQRASADSHLIPKAALEACYRYYAPGRDAEERRDPAVSPLYADLSGLPPALFTCGTLDPLYDDTLFMARRWEAAGNDVELAIYPDAIHGFVGFPTEMAARARARIGEFLAAHL